MNNTKVNVQVSIIIVTYNTKIITQDCLNSIKEFTTDINYEVILVDNASLDGSKEVFEDNKDITFIYSKENLGFGRANNLGVKSAQGEFVFFLNSDTILIENSILKFYNFFILHEKELKIGVLGCLLIDQYKQVNGFGNTFPTINKEKNRIWSKIPILSKFISKNPDKVYETDKDFFEIDYVIGADMFLRKALFEQMNGFYFKFFMYFEETDLQKRIANQGFKQYIFTTTNIIHLEEASGKAINNYSNRKKIITDRSRLLYLKRNDSKNYSNYVFTDFLFVILNFFNFKYTFKENLEYFKEILKAY